MRKKLIPPAVTRIIKMVKRLNLAAMLIRRLVFVVDIIH
jgi:hypothetical protein